MWQCFIYTEAEGILLRDGSFSHNKMVDSCLNGALVASVSVLTKLTNFIRHKLPYSSLCGSLCVIELISIFFPFALANAPPKRTDARP